MRGFPGEWTREWGSRTLERGTVVLTKDTILYIIISLGPDTFKRYGLSPGNREFLFVFCGVSAA